MDHESLSIENYPADESCQIRVDVRDDIRRYKQLSSHIRRGQKEIVESLLEEGTPVNYCYPTNDLQTPLHSSVYLGDLDIVEKLLHKGASVNAEFFHDTPLTLAAKFRKTEITDLLLSDKGLKNYCNNEGLTHFHVACMRNQVNIAKNLLKNLKDINIAVNSDSEYWPGFTSLHFAVEFQCIETVQFLLSVGARITIEDARELTPLHLAYMIRNEEIVDMILMTHDKVLSNPENSKHLTHFHIACTRNNLKIVKHFIKLGVDPEDRFISNTDGEWKIAIDLAIHYECIDVVRFLSQFKPGTNIASFYECGRINDAHSVGNMEIVNILSSDDRLSLKPVATEIPSEFLPSFDNDDSEIIDELARQSHTTLSARIISNSTLLHLAVEHEERTVIEYLLSRVVDFTIQNGEGNSPLHLVFERNMKDYVDLMLKDHHKFDRNPFNNDGISHLHIACARNNTDTIHHLVKIGANVNSSVNLGALRWAGFSPLHFAAKFGNVEATKALLEYGANYSVVDASNLSVFDTALVEANKTGDGGCFRVMKSILKHHSEQKDSEFIDRGVSLMHLAVEHPYIIDSTVESAMQVIETHSEDVNKAIHVMNCNWDGYTPLHFAAQKSDDHDFNLLIELGADILKQASNGDTPLHLLREKINLPQIVIDPHDSRLSKLNYVGSQGYSIFHKACEQTNLEWMRYFLEHGVDVNYPTIELRLGCDDCSPLHLAVLNESISSIEAVRLLANYGADPNWKDYQNNTVLHCTTDNPNSEIIDILARHGADVNARNGISKTPLISVCSEIELDDDQLNGVISSLLNNGADINLADRWGATVLSQDCWLELCDENLVWVAVVHTLLRHVIKLRVAGFYVSETNMKFYSSLLRTFASELQSELNFVEDTFTDHCVQELQIMKQTRTDSYTTLYDILFQSSNKLAVTSRNVAFQQIVNSSDFQEKFPIYGFMLKLQLRRGQIRWPLLSGSRTVLNHLLGVTLPRACTEDILRHLDNQDLKNIITSRKQHE